MVLISSVLGLLGCSAASSSNASYHMYVANCVDSTVWTYTIDAKTGALGQLTGSPVDAGLLLYSITVTPSGKFVYVANINSNDISAYAINSSNGALIPVTGSPFTAGTCPIAITNTKMSH